mgnify:CR=1 FL=1
MAQKNPDTNGQGSHLYYLYDLLAFYTGQFSLLQVVHLKVL